MALARWPAIPIPADLQRMTDLTSSMVRQALDAFVNLDAKLARLVCRLDDEVDRYNKSIIDELIRLMQRSPDMVEPGLSFFSATRHLERIADHATNIAEDVIYLVEGDIVRHRPAAVRRGGFRTPIGEGCYPDDDRCPPPPTTVGRRAPGSWSSRTSGP